MCCISVYFTRIRIIYSIYKKNIEWNDNDIYKNIILRYRIQQRNETLNC